MAEAIVFPGFHLNEDKNPACTKKTGAATRPSDDIDFTVPIPVIPFNDPITSLLQIAGGQFFTSLPENIAS